MKSLLFILIAVTGVASPVKMLESVQKLRAELKPLLPSFRDEQSTDQAKARIELNEMVRDGDIVDGCWLAARQKKDSTAIVDRNRVEAIELTKDMAKHSTLLRVRLRRVISDDNWALINEELTELENEIAAYLKQLESKDFP